MEQVKQTRRAPTVTVEVGDGRVERPVGRKGSLKDAAGPARDATRDRFNGDGTAIVTPEGKVVKVLEPEYKMTNSPSNG